MAKRTEIHKTKETPYVIWLENLRRKDLPSVGGKNASLGEMLSQLKQKGIHIPDGFATTSAAYWEFLKINHLPEKIRLELEKLRKGKQPLETTGSAIRGMLLHASFPPRLKEEIVVAYRELCKRAKRAHLDVAVRSSATAEDLPDASFAGQQETFLNIRGEEALLEACRKCFASLFTNRAISYRSVKHFDPFKIALSIGIQRMVRSDLSGAGVMFTLDTESGFRNVAVINAAWGLGENVVQGAVTPDEYIVFKPLLNKKDIVPILEKSLGDKEKKMIYKESGITPVKNVETSLKEKGSFVL